MITMQEGKLRVLCLHGSHTNAAIFEKQIHRWDSSILQLLNLNFLDGPYATSGKSEVEAIFPGLYFEWFQFNKDYSEFINLEECKDFLSKYMQEHGPFDGLMGFSQGGVQAAAFAGLQQKGMVLQGHPPLRFIILVSGIGLNNKQAMHECYSEIVLCPSAHIIGDKDCLRKINEKLMQKFKNPLIIRHQEKHTVPRLGEEQTKLLRDFHIQIQFSILAVKSIKEESETSVVSMARSSNCQESFQSIPRAKEYTAHSIDIECGYGSLS
ncbi:hypothetical protein L7F22_027822 [Adiantum nelumboides]|nr:hypothetical protein [Adiantum nelumboides]